MAKEPRIDVQIIGKKHISVFTSINNDVCVNIKADADGYLVLEIPDSIIASIIGSEKLLKKFQKKPT